jgi:hypothetical protein
LSEHQERQNHSDFRDGETLELLSMKVDSVKVSTTYNWREFFEQAV